MRRASGPVLMSRAAVLAHEIHFHICKNVLDKLPVFFLIKFLTELIGAEGWV